MTVSTQIIWTFPLAQETIDAVNTRSEELIDSGIEIGTVVKVSGPGVDQATFTRTWINETAATEWITFIQPYGPDSAIILS
jgi:hypothetical protein